MMNFIVGSDNFCSKPAMSLSSYYLNMKHYKSVEFLSIFRMSSLPAQMQSPHWRLSGEDSVWTVHWSINKSIQSYIKQPVSLLGFNTAQSWISSLWPGCGKWNGQRNAAILVVSSTTQHGLCLTSDTTRLFICSEMSKINSITATKLAWRRSRSRSLWSKRSKRFARRLFFDLISLSKPSKSDVRAQLPWVNFIWNEILMNSMKYWNALSFFPGYCLLGVDQSWNDLFKRFGREGLVGSAVQILPFFPRPVVTAGYLEHSKHIMPPSACRMNILFICSDSSKPFSLIHHWKVLLFDADDWLLAENDDAFEILTVECFSSVSSCMTESKEPLQSLLLAFAISGWLTVRNLLLYSWTASFTFLLWHYLLKILIQESKCIKSGKALVC